MSRKNSTGNGCHSNNDLELNQQLKLGDTTWVKIRKSSWWPAQLVDEKNVDCKPKKKAKDGVLVRLYGSYDYLYVDPVKSGSEFENIIKQKNTTIREAIQKALEEELSRNKSAGKKKRKASNSEVINLDDDEDDDPISSKEAAGDQKERDEERGKASTKRKQDGANNKSVKQGVVGDEASKGKSVKQGGSGKTKVTENGTSGASRVKPVKSRVGEHRDPQNPIPTPPSSVRRVRVMQRLGLIAPEGSPFKKKLTC